MPRADVNVRRATTQADLSDVRALFEAYARSLDVDLCFQGFEEELASLPGKYAPPHGALFLARDVDANPVGCIALRPLPLDRACEMKRLYIAPAARGQGLGRLLVERLVAEAGRLGYGSVMLDTLPSMKVAQALYLDMGFVPTAPYYDTPVAGTVFLVRELPA